MEGVWKNFEDYVGRSLSCLQQTVHRILVIEDSVLEATKGGKEYVIGNCKKRNLSDITKTIGNTTVCTKIRSKNVPNYLGNLAKVISKESVKYDT